MSIPIYRFSLDRNLTRSENIEFLNKIAVHYKILAYGLWADGEVLYSYVAQDAIDYIRMDLEQHAKKAMLKNG